MIVSWNWLKEYVLLDMPLAELETRLMMSGLNHEGTQEIQGDMAIDLEVTSNRPDCLGHLGVAREVAVLWQRELELPRANPHESSSPIAKFARVDIECSDLCPRYSARVIRNVKVAPSPAWIQRRLTTLGIACVNNVVDISNYVLMECGQPLHVFDFDKLAGSRILVRQAKAGEEFEAINHKTYRLEPEMCVIADEKRTVALAGVMGGLDTEVTLDTSDLLIESALFNPISVRNTARRLNLHSDSSYRFERALDPQGVDWASRRCSELILDIAGGELAQGVINVGTPAEPRSPVVLRFSQLKRILGIDIDREEVCRILTALGNRPSKRDEKQVEVVPPSWRQDLSREIDLVEEVARIHGYDKIPEDVNVPMAPSSPRKLDRVLRVVRGVLTSSGMDEALTLSAVDEAWNEAFSPWTEEPAVRSQIPVLRGASCLRRSLIPSLLGSRKINEALANPWIELFESAHIYLQRQGGPIEEKKVLALTKGEEANCHDFRSVKGILESILSALHISLPLEMRPFNSHLFKPGRGAELRLANEGWGYMGEVSPAGLEEFDLRAPCTVAEIDIAPLVRLSELIPKYIEPSSYPAIQRDVNLVVDERVHWAEVEKVASNAAGALLESLRYTDTYRDEKKLGLGKKSLLFSASFRSTRSTLTNPEVDAMRDKIVAACGKQLGAELRA